VPLNKLAGMCSGFRKKLNTERWRKQHKRNKMLLEKINRNYNKTKKKKLRKNKNKKKETNCTNAVCYRANLA